MGPKGGGKPQGWEAPQLNTGCGPLPTCTQSGRLTKRRRQASLAPSLNGPAQYPAVAPPPAPPCEPHPSAPLLYHRAACPAKPTSPAAGPFSVLPIARLSLRRSHPEPQAPIAARWHRLEARGFTAVTGCCVPHVTARARHAASQGQQCLRSCCCCCCCCCRCGAVRPTLLPAPPDSSGAKQQPTPSLHAVHDRLKGRASDATGATKVAAAANAASRPPEATGTAPCLYYVMGTRCAWPLFQHPCVPGSRPVGALGWFTVWWMTCPRVWYSSLASCC